MRVGRNDFDYACDFERYYILLLFDILHNLCSSENGTNQIYVNLSYKVLESQKKMNNLQKNKI